MTAFDSSAPIRRSKVFPRRTTSGPGPEQAGNSSTECADSRCRFRKLTGSSPEARPRLVGELLRVGASHNAVVLGVECSYPESGGPRHPEFFWRECTTTRTLIRVEEQFAFVDRRRALHVGSCEDRRSSTGHGCFRTGRSAVPVMHDERLAVLPAHVLRFPVDVTNDEWSCKGDEDPARSFANLIQPAGFGMCIEIPLAVIAERPHPGLIVI